MLYNRWSIRFWLSDTISQNWVNGPLILIAHIFITVKTQSWAHTQIHTHAQIPAYVQLPTLFQPHVPLQPSAHLCCDQALCPVTISANHPFPAEILITHRPCTTSADGNGQSPSGVLAYTPWQPEVGFIGRIIFHHLLRLACTLFLYPSLFQHLWSLFTRP